MKNRMPRKFVIISTLILLLAPSNVRSENGSLADTFWLQIMANGSYFKTGYGSNTPGNIQEDYYWLRTYLDFGARFDFHNRFYLDLFFNTDYVNDFGKEKWNKNFGKNNFAWGPSIRLGYQYTFPENSGSRFLRLEEINIDLFSDYMTLEDSFDSGKDSIPDGIYRENLAVGISSYISAASKTFNSWQLWLEFYNGLTYNDTASSEIPNRHYYFLQSQPIWGMSWHLNKITVQPYLQMYLSYDLGQEDHNKLPWTNYIEYGPGIRLSMGKLIPVESTDLYLYYEYSWLDYFDRINPEDVEGSADYDYRIGLILRFQFGAIKDYLKLH